MFSYSYSRLWVVVLFMAVMIGNNSLTMEPASEGNLASNSLGLLELPDDMLAKILIHTSHTSNAKFSAGELVPYARNSYESSKLDKLKTTGKISAPEIIPHIESRAQLSLALAQIKPLLSTSRKARSLLLNPTIAKAVLNHFKTEYQALPLYVATQLHQSSIIPIVENTHNGLADWYDQKKLKRNFRGQLREVVAMILADTHDQHRIKKASWLINQKNNALTADSFTLILNNLLRVYRTSDKESVGFLLDKNPPFETVIMPNCFNLDDCEYIMDDIIKRFPSAKAQLSPDQLERFQHLLDARVKDDAEKGKSANSTN